jgi:hypothetical protein
MSDPQSKATPSKATPSKVAPSKVEAKAPAEGETPRSRLSWVVGWVLVPTTIVGVLFGGGVLVGAHFPDAWLSRLIVWCVELFA